MADRDKIRKSEGDGKFRPAQNLDPDLAEEIDEALGEMSVEDLLESPDERSAAGEDKTARGIHKGKVIAIEGDDIFVEMGGKRQGLLPGVQYDDEPLPQIGDVVECTIEGTDERDGLLLLSRKGAIRAATWDNIEEGQIVEGRVTGYNKGGLELTIDGIDAFMPISQIERFRVERLEDYFNQRLRCCVTEVDRSEDKIIVSRRELLELEARKKRDELLESLEPGQSVTGTVKSITPFGAFVDIGGIDGLLHVADMSYSRVEKIEDVVSPGDEVRLVVLKVDRDARRISLGLKQTRGDPWADVETKFPAQAIVSGRVTRLAPFGAFVELRPGCDGLVPLGELSYHRRVHHPREIVSEGEVVKVRVMNVDTEKRRITLSLKQVEDDPWTGASVRWAVDSVIEGRVTRTTQFGAFVELVPGVEGLIHISELKDGFVRSVTDVVREGDLVQAKVISVDEETRRISLSVKKLTESPESPRKGDSQPPPAKAKKRTRPLKGGLD